MEQEQADQLKTQSEENNGKIKGYLVHAGLFILTLITTTLAGAEWSFQRMLFYTDPAMSWEDFLGGFSFSFPFLLALTVHEFGHYFTAKYYQVRVTLPYYIPVWFGFIGMPSIGTMGAFIRIKDAITSRKIFFDIGIAGPLAGFVVAIGVLFYGFTHLPAPDEIFDIHPEYLAFGEDYQDYVYSADTIIYKEDLQFLDQETLSQLEDSIVFDSSRPQIKLGNNLLFIFFTNYVADDPEMVPNPYEIYHFPWLLAGYLILLFTAINLIPVGQLDGGHVLYGLIGYKKHRTASAVIFIAFVFYTGLGLVNPHLFNEQVTWGIPNFIIEIGFYLFFLYYTFYSLSPDKKTRWIVSLSVLASQLLLLYFFPTLKGSSGWLLFAFLIGRFLGVYHPPALFDQPLDLKRQVLGWIALIIFVISFSPSIFVS